MIDGNSGLSSLGGFTDSGLARLATECGRLAGSDADPAWVGLLLEVAVLAAGELDRRRAALRALDRDADGLVDADEVGGIVDPSTVSWAADRDPVAAAWDEITVRWALGGDG